MLRTIIIRELSDNLLSLRFYIAFLFMLVLFGFGAVTFVRSYPESVAEYEKYESTVRNRLERTAEESLTSLAIKEQDYILKPRATRFICGAKEKYIPNRVTFSAFNVFGFKTRLNDTNPFLNPLEELNWGFIISVILSFTIFLFTFDSIAGEKETRTLAISLANSVSRTTLLFGKYLATIIAALAMIIPGICISVIVILFSGVTPLSSGVLGEILGFFLVSVLFILCIAAFGLLASVLAKRSDVSLLMALTLWVMFVVVVPNSAIPLSRVVSPIDTADAVQEKVQNAADALEKSGPRGKWFMQWNQPFYPFHKVRANHQMNLMNSEMRIRNAHYDNMFRQIDRARLLTLVSPVCLYDYLCEEVVGGGYPRFRHVWSGVHAYQLQFLTFFKAKDALDPGSPHWYNPREEWSTSNKPVNFSEVPAFTETPVPFKDRAMSAGVYLIVMMLVTALVFCGTAALFARYDVR